MCLTFMSGCALDADAGQPVDWNARLIIRRLIIRPVLIGTDPILEVVYCCPGQLLTCPGKSARPQATGKSIGFNENVGSR